jgi:ribosomal protein S3
LHRAGSDFYLNFITTKLYYRYILSDVIKPIVRISLKFYRGFVINCNGRFTRAQIAVSKKFVRKSVSYSKITSSLDYAQRSVVLKYGTCNLRIWIRK